MTDEGLGRLQSHLKEAGLVLSVKLSRTGEVWRALLSAVEHHLEEMGITLVDKRKPEVELTTFNMPIAVLGPNQRRDGAFKLFPLGIRTWEFTCDYLDKMKLLVNWSDDGSDKRACFAICEFFFFFAVSIVL